MQQPVSRQAKFNAVALAILWPAFALVCGFLAWIIYDQVRQPQLINAAIYPKSMRSVPEFELSDVDGVRFGKDRLRGNWSLLMLGYTYCPDVCPQGLQTLSRLLNRVEPDSVQVIFVSVDPLRDAPQKLKDYVEYFNPRIVPVTATPERLEQFSHALGAEYAIAGDPLPGERYFIEHSAEIFVFNPAAELYAIMPPPYQAEQIKADLAMIIDHFGGS